MYLKMEKAEKQSFPFAFQFQYYLWKWVCVVMITLLQFFGDLSSHGVDWLFLYFNNKAKAAL